MNATNAHPNNEENNSDQSKNKDREENISLIDDNGRPLRVNPITAVNPPPPPLPGVFIFDRPNQQQKSSHHLDTKCNVSTESYNHCKNNSSLPSSGPSGQFCKTISSGQGARDTVHTSSNIYQSAPTNLQSTVSEVTDSMLPTDADIHHIQSLEPITLNTFEDSLQSSESKVYHQLHAISPNHYKLAEEPKLYHEMAPVTLASSSLPKEEFIPENYRQLNPVPVVEDPIRINKTFQELKPLTPQYYDDSQYVNSKLYQQLCQPPMNEENAKYQLKDQKYQQLRPATVIDFEKTSNRKNHQTTQQQFLNIPENAYPRNTESKHDTNQGLIRDSVINKAETQISRPTSQTTKSKYPNSQTINHNESHVGYKEDKPKVYLELRNPSFRTQLTKPSTHHSQYPDTFPEYENPNTPVTFHSSLQAVPRLQKSPEFKLPGPYEFNLPQQNSPNKYKLPKILGHNEYRSPELILKPTAKRREGNIVPPFGTQKMSALLLPSSSTMFNRNTPFKGVRNKVPLSLPKTPLCYGDPGVDSKVSYYPNQTTFVSSNSEPSVIQTNASCFKKPTEISAPTENMPYSEPINSHSKLREELLKPKVVVKKFGGIASEEGVDKGSPIKDNDSQLIDAENRSNIKLQVTYKDRECIKPFSCGYDSLPSKFMSQESFNQINPCVRKLNSENFENPTITTDRPNQCEQFPDSLTISKIKKVQVQEVVNMESANGVIVSSGNNCSNKVDILDRSVSDMNSSSVKVEIKRDENQCSVKSDHRFKQRNFENSLVEKSDSRILIDSCKHRSSRPSALSVKHNVEEISNPESITEQSVKLNTGEDKTIGIIEGVDRSETNPVRSNIINGITDKGEGDCKDKIKEICVDKDLVKTSVEEVVLENVVSLEKREERNLDKNADEAVSIITANNCVYTNPQNDDISSIKSNSLEVKEEVSVCKEIKVKRKYNKRIVPENERRKHTKRKASMGLEDIIAREKRTYTKRNTIKIPISEKSKKYNYNEDKVAGNDNASSINEEVQNIKEEVASEEEKYINDHLSHPAQLPESAPRIKRKYTRRKFKNKDFEEKTIKTNERVKRKYTKRVVSKEIQKERIFKNNSSSKMKHKFVDPLEEGLITDDEGEAVFLGFDMTDEEDETILGFESDSEEDSGSDLRFDFVTKLEEADCMTVECDPRSLLQPAGNTTACGQCGESFGSHAELVAHMQRHSSAQTHHRHSYVCSVCFRGFSTQVQLDRHVKWTHEGGKKHKCAKCPKMFTTRAYAKRHAETAHKGEEMKITVESAWEEENIKLTVETAHNEEEMKIDAETAHKEEEKLSTETVYKQEEIEITTFYCGECSETFKTEDKLKEHENKVHKKTLFQCEKCLRYFQKFANLQRHRLSHNGESEGQDFPCAYCNEKFSSRESLHAHWPVHTEKKVFTCDICNSNFTALNSLKRHRILHTGEKLFRCEICQRSFSLLNTLKTHLLIHTGARRFECKLCGKTFNRRDVLNAHQWVHTGEKKFQCDICFQKFRWRHAVRSHKLIYHSTEKPYTCQVCGKRFSHPDSFKKHAEVHADRLFYCQICLKAFSRASTLKAHITTHTDLKPFFCDKCHRGFRSKSHLRNHFLVHTKEKPWLCKFCNKTYKDRTQLRRHKRVVHCKAFYEKALLPEVYEAIENFEMMADAQAGYDNQMEHSFEEVDCSKHFISLPVESDFPKIEENIVPPSVF